MRILLTYDERGEFVAWLIQAASGEILKACETKEEAEHYLDHWEAAA